MVMLFLGPSPCNTCGGTQPSRWKCDPLDLLVMGGGELRYTMLESELGDVLRVRTAISVPIPPYECEGLPWQVGPRLQELVGSGVSVALYLVVRVPDDQVQAWDEGEFRPKSQDVVTVLMYLKGFIQEDQLAGIGQYMQEGQEKVGKILWRLLLVPKGV